MGNCMEIRKSDEYCSKEKNEKVWGAAPLEP